MACLYRIQFPCGKSYVGISATTAESRFYKHTYSARNGSALAVHRAIRKYGRNAALLETLVVGDWSYVTALEQRAIAAFGTRAPHGYNLTNGGDGLCGYRHSEATRAKLRARVYSPEVRARMSASAMGVQKKPNTSGVPGVYWDKSISKWRPRIMLDGRVHYLGVFCDWFEAVAARKSAESRLLEL